MNSGAGNVVPRPARSLEEFVERVFQRAELPAWMVHLETGQIVWSSAPARASIDAYRAGGETRREGQGEAREPKQGGHSAATPTVALDSHALWSSHHERGEIRCTRVVLGGLTYELVVVHLAPSDPRERLFDDPSLGERAIPRYWQDRFELPARLAEVAALLAQGLAVTSIAEALGVTRQSAGTYVKRVMRRLPQEERKGLAHRRVVARSNSHR
jgi:DNA-binding CsgD family transcriptional regulator